MLRYIFLILSSSLFAYDTTTAITENEPSAYIEGVNVITGNYCPAGNDLVVQGAEPIPLKRLFISGRGQANTGHKVLPAAGPLVYHPSYKNSSAVFAYDSNGTCLLFRPRPSNDAFFDAASPEEIPGLTNTSRGILSAHTNLQNFHVEHKDKQFIVHCPDKTKRYYTRISQQIEPIHGHKLPQHYRLHKEELPNGHFVFYDYIAKDGRLKSIRTTSSDQQRTFAHLTLDYAGSLPKGVRDKHGNIAYETKPRQNARDFKVTTSDGRTVFYTYQRYAAKVKKGTFFSYHLQKITSPHLPPVEMQYHSPETPHVDLLSQESLPDSRYRSVEYYPDGRVKTISAPAGSDAQPIAIYKFTYDDPGRLTTVFDSQGNKTEYRYTPQQRVESIRRYIGDELHSIETFSWKGCNLESRTVLDSQEKALISRSFAYDDFGNVIEEKIVFDDKTILKKYAYNEDHLLKRLEEPSGKVTLFQYKPGTNLIELKTTCDGEIPQFIEKFDYNHDNILIRETVNDFEQKTCKIRKITPYAAGAYIGMPHIVEEFYSDGIKESPLKKTILSYTTGGKVNKQEIYDADAVFQYSLTAKYNNLGLPEEETNPLGRVAKSTYDANGNKKTYTDFDGRVTQKMGYDFCNRLTTIQENVRQTTHTYNTLGQRTSTTDPFKQITTFKHDPFGHILETSHPLATACKTYDTLGYLATSTDPNGHTTRYTHNPLGKPTLIEYPDGTHEIFSYNLDGTLEFHIDKGGTKTSYTYDFLGRIKTKTTPLTHESFIYDAFHLISHTDAEGNITIYEYDLAGRKIAEQIGEERTEFGYDSLGRLNRIQKGELISITEYDLLDRTIEKREETPSKQLLRKVRYEYKPDGSESAVIRYINGQESKEITFYDIFKRKRAHVDALGHITRWEYDEHFINAQSQTVLQVIETDPLGTQTLTTYDTLGRIASIEKKSPFGESLYLEEFTCDANGNTERQIMTLPGRKTIFNWKYDSMNRIKLLTEAEGTPEQRITSYTYNARGLLFEVFKPDGLVLEHTYDALGRPETLTASDKTVDYKYTYNGLGQEVQVEDRILGQITERAFDPQGRLYFEKLGHGLALTSAYDHTGRRRTLTLPDRTFIEYDYEGSFLKTVSRGEYTHEFSRYDLDGNLLEEKLIHTGESVVYTPDPLGRVVSLASPYINQKIIEFDHVGNIRSMSRDNEPSNFAYDIHYQLQSEQGKFTHSYEHDALHNRLQKDGQSQQLNHLNQLNTVEYDLNGNPKADGDRIYAYDALDRLVSVETPITKLVFTYDSDHRRLSKTVFEKGLLGTTETSRLFFLYDGPREIGAITSDGRISELRVLSETPSEIGSAIAIELHGKVYAPIHDLQGNVAVLIDPTTGQIAESYHYSAFGEEEWPSKLGNPWRYASKRIDDETGLVFFGRRYYEPSKGRWLTPDPAGFADSMNLYTYVKNNPLGHWDLFGLYETSGISASDLNWALDKGGAVADLAVSCAMNTGSRSNFVVINNQITHLSPSAGVSLPLSTTPTWQQVANYNATQALINSQPAVSTASMYAHQGLDFIRMGAPLALSIHPISRWAMTLAPNIVFPLVDGVVNYGHTLVDRWYGTDYAAQFKGSDHYASVFEDPSQLVWELAFKGVAKSISCIPKGLSLVSKTDPLISASGLSYTKSNLQLGRQMHIAYKLNAPGIKEFRLPSGRRIDFLDPVNGIIYELKPNNPRAIRLGQQQLKLYLEEIQAMPRYKNIDWKTILETY